MKRFLLFFLLMTALTATAQKEDETKEIELKEVTVKSARTVQRTDRQWIFPSKQQIEASPNGYSLLAKLTLPHLRIDPTMHTITALGNLGNV